MNGPLRVAEITDYLAHNGWYKQPEQWRGAAIWSMENGCDVLVPARDGLGDGELRVRQVVEALAVVEGRPAQEIALDIGAPPADLLRVRAHPRGMPSGQISLKGLGQQLNSLTGLFVSVGRVLMDGPHISSRGRMPRDVRGLVDRVQLGPTQPGSYVLPVRVPVDDFARRVVIGLHGALVAVRGAVTAGDVTAFHDTLTEGVSADLCEALSGLACEDQPFEVGFRWAHALPSGLPAQTLRFPSGAGELIRSAAGHLRQTKEFGSRTVTGDVDLLANGSWLVRVNTGRNSIWVQLPTLTSYDAALAARQEGHRVRANGVLVVNGLRIELLVEHNGFEVLG